MEKQKDYCCICGKILDENSDEAVDFCGLLCWTCLFIPVQKESEPAGEQVLELEF